jgi:serine/threonine protein kinase
MLVDFGIAKIALPGKVTLPGSRGMGSPGYAPPEQYSGGTDERSDVYALGATMYFALTGSAPPEPNLRAAGKESLAAPRQINHAISPTIEQAILTAMNLDASQRYDSVSALERALSKDSPMGSTKVISPSLMVGQTTATARTAPQVALPSQSVLFLVGGSSILIIAFVVVLAFISLPATPPTFVGATPTRTALQIFTAPSATLSQQVRTAVLTSTPPVPSAAPTRVLKRVDPVIGTAFDEGASVSRRDWRQHNRSRYQQYEPNILDVGVCLFCCLVSGWAKGIDFVLGNTLWSRPLQCARIALGEC